MHVLSEFYSLKLKWFIIIVYYRYNVRCLGSYIMYTLYHANCKKRKLLTLLLLIAKLIRSTIVLLISMIYHTSLDKITGCPLQTE